MKAGGKPAAQRLPADDKAAIAELRQRICEKIAANPAKAAIILTEWLQKKKAA